MPYSGSAMCRRAPPVVVEASDGVRALGLQPPLRAGSAEVAQPRQVGRRTRFEVAQHQRRDRRHPPPPDLRQPVPLFHRADQRRAAAAAAPLRCGRVGTSQLVMSATKLDWRSWETHQHRAPSPPSAPTAAPGSGSPRPAPPIGAAPAQALTLPRCHSASSSGALLAATCAAMCRCCIGSRRNGQKYPHCGSHPLRALQKRSTTAVACSCAW